MLVVLLVTALLLQPSTLPGQRYLPAIQVNQYHWPQTGFSVMGAFRDKIPLFYAENGDGPPMWFQDWWLGCEAFFGRPAPKPKGVRSSPVVDAAIASWENR